MDFHVRSWAFLKAFCSLKFSLPELYRYRLYIPHHRRNVNPPECAFVPKVQIGNICLVWLPAGSMASESG